MPLHVASRGPVISHGSILCTWRPNDPLESKQFPTQFVEYRIKHTHTNDNCITHQPQLKVVEMHTWSSGWKRVVIIIVVISHNCVPQLYLIPKSMSHAGQNFALLGLFVNL
jgi:hypothetical protein